MMEPAMRHAAAATTRGGRTIPRSDSASLSKSSISSSKVVHFGNILDVWKFHSPTFSLIGQEQGNLIIFRPGDSDVKVENVRVGDKVFQLQIEVVDLFVEIPRPDDTMTFKSNQNHVVSQWKFLCDAENLIPPLREVLTITAVGLSLENMTILCQKGFIVIPF